MNSLKIFFKNNYFNTIIVLILSLITGFFSFILSEKLKIFFNTGIMNNDVQTIQNNIFIIFFLFIFMFILNISSSRVSSFYTSIIFMVSRLIEMIIYLYIIFKISFYAGLFSLIAIPLTLLFTIGIKKKMADYQMKMLEKSRELSSSTIESLDSIKNIKVKNAYDYFLNKIEKKNINLTNAVVKSAIAENYWQYMNGLINSIVPILVIYLIMKFTNIINISTGNIIILYSFIPLFLSSFKGFYSLIMQFFSSKPFLKSIKEYDILKRETSGNTKLNTFEELTVKDLKININSERDLKIPDMKIKKGEKIFISGESGIGKSSFFNVLLKLNSNYDGSIKINGIELKDISNESIRKLFGISFQNAAVFSDTIENNILLGKSNKKLENLIKISQLEDVLKRNNSKKINNNILSGGEKSRINIAQNLANEPEIIMIDESLTSVDEKMEYSIFENIVNNFKDKTILCISHRNSSKDMFDKEIKIF
ncbi:MAG: hypothetical protein PWP28_2195 [Oceanotoga sp.]|uniref:ABC transporter ATP-binding protein n=1 Tax=Oceanotoga sp. TaxID=2108366 RepID=UPI00265541BC|nr:ABC transporter ATP-binding protein [Oceanotoga sp.]MDN5343320.1 hypothetical protein [Oceanotoga sp.]